MYKLEKFYRQGFNPQQYWDDRYAREHIAGRDLEEYRAQGFWPVLKEQLKKDGKYLDAGCAVGGWVIFLKEEGYDVTGVDIAARALRAMTEYDPDLQVKAGSLTALPLAKESFEGVLSIGSLEYVENKVPEALKEMRRVLKPGGLLFMEVPLANAIRRFIYLPLKKVEKSFKQAQGKQASFSNYLFTRASIKEQLEQAGFAVIEMRAHELPEADSHYGLYVDWPFLRGKEAYKLNWLGRIVKIVCNAISPWMASTGVVVIAKKK